MCFPFKRRHDTQDQGSKSSTPKRSASSENGPCLIIDKPNHSSTITLNSTNAASGQKCYSKSLIPTVPATSSQTSSHTSTTIVGNRSFYRGDNPKYSPGTIATGRARRGGVWLSFRLWLGDGVHEVLENKRRAKLKKRVAFKEKWRKRLFLKPKPPKWCIEDKQDVCGKMILVRMKRFGVSRSGGVYVGWRGV